LRPSWPPALIEATHWRSHERFRRESIIIVFDERDTAPVSELPLDGDGDEVHQAGRRQLLEMHRVRRSVERHAFAERFVQQAEMAAIEVSAASFGGAVHRP
jgi:hypothetical protein